MAAAAAALQRRHVDRILLGAVIAVFAGFAIAYTRITPIGASPDELAHLNYIDGIADHLRLPPAGEQERQQPPLYYLLGALVAKLSGGDVRLIRLLSVGLGVLTILIVYLVARRLFPQRPALAVGSAALVALLPETQYLAGAVNDDNLAWLAGALLVLVGVVVVQSGALTTEARARRRSGDRARGARQGDRLGARRAAARPRAGPLRPQAPGAARPAAPRAGGRPLRMVVRSQCGGVRRAAAAAAPHHQPAPGLRTRWHRCAATSPRRP